MDIRLESSNWLVDLISSMRLNVDKLGYRVFNNVLRVCFAAQLANSVVSAILKKLYELMLVIKNEVEVITYSRLLILISSLVYIVFLIRSFISYPVSSAMCVF